MVSVAPHVMMVCASTLERATKRMAKKWMIHNARDKPASQRLVTKANAVKHVRVTIEMKAVPQIKK